jgi:hypothetical protein
MTWEMRLAALLLAGGTIAGCSSSNNAPPPEGFDAGPFPGCRANGSGDPCCDQPDNATCKNGKTIDAGSPEAGAEDAGADATDAGHD